MSKKYLKFKKFYKSQEWNVLGKNDVVIGGILKGELFKKRYVLTGIDDLTEWTSECLHQAADFLESIENKTKGASE